MKTTMQIWAGEGSKSYQGSERKEVRRLHGVAPMPRTSSTIPSSLWPREEELSFPRLQGGNVPASVLFGGDWNLRRSNFKIHSCHCPVPLVHSGLLPPQPPTPSIPPPHHPVPPPSLCSLHSPGAQ